VGAPSFSRVVVTGDLLRPFFVGARVESATWKNVRWLHGMLEAPLRASGLTARMLAWDERGAPETTAFFDTPSLYDALGLDLDLASWAALCADGRTPQALVEMLAPQVEDALVIGYELPPPLIAALERLGRPVVDLILHPVRFMPDLIFALRTNVPAWDAWLRARRLDEAAIAERAGHIRAKAAWMAAPMPLPPGTALVLGQVASDRAMIQADGGFASLERHCAFLHELCCRHPRVLFRPHPYAAPDDPCERAIARLPAIRRTDANFYHLLAQPELTTVVALNSSGLIEARHFGRESINLMPWLYDFDACAPAADGRTGTPVPLSSAWATAAFWRGLLQDDAQASPAPLPDHTLRRAMNADWGYGFIERICA
jgi:hypothetical protein